MGDGVTIVSDFTGNIYNLFVDMEFFMKFKGNLHGNIYNSYLFEVFVANVNKEKR